MEKKTFRLFKSLRVIFIVFLIFCLYVIANTQFKTSFQYSNTVASNLFEIEYHLIGDPALLKNFGSILI